MIRLPAHDESLMPIYLGPITRVPEYALKKYGVEWETDSDWKKLINISEIDYAVEWERGNKEQMESVSKASERAGFGDKPQMLRESAAKIITYLAKGVDGRITIYDHGAGPGYSAKTIFEHLGENEKDRVFFILLDPAKDKLFGNEGEKGALQVLEDLGMKYKKDFQLIADTDLNSLNYMGPQSVNFFVGVASIHHHSHIPFELYYTLLKKDGFLVSSDWHNSIWEEPYRYYKFLERFNWPNKKEGLKNFRENYPRANNPVPDPVNPADVQANEDITGFWLGYHELLKESGQLGRGAIWPSEGHRPVERYEEQMKGVGFNLESEEIVALKEAGVIDKNPHQLVPGTRLWITIVGKKS